MFAGEKMNITENRAVLHTALRRGSGPLLVEGCDVMEQVLARRTRMLEFAEAVRSGAVHGQGGAYTDVVNIGIGGSDLGPAMACLALKPYAQGPRCHFVSNVDGAHITDILEDLDPRTTLVIVASKTFTTIETLTNAQTALRWMAEAVERPADQFVALSTAEDKTSDFGIAADRVFGFEDWVGGRYSVWGPIGLSLAIAIGAEHFQAFLSGAEAMDRHFQTAAAQKTYPLSWPWSGCGMPRWLAMAPALSYPMNNACRAFPPISSSLKWSPTARVLPLTAKSLPTPLGPSFGASRAPMGSMPFIN